MTIGVVQTCLAVFLVAREEEESDDGVDIEWVPHLSIGEEGVEYLVEQNKRTKQKIEQS